MSDIRGVLNVIRYQGGDPSSMRLLFRCPGCNLVHGPTVGPPHPSEPSAPRWSWNGSFDKPTFDPSLLVRWHTWTPPVTHENHAEFKRAPWVQTKVESVCHSFIREGRIQFLNDCTHELAGMTVEIPPFTWNDYD